MTDIWIRIRIKLRWLLAAVVATKEQSIRDHALASQVDDPQRRAELRASGDLQDEASEGLKVVQNDIGNDGDRG